jgi:hypothetical protein
MAYHSGRNVCGLTVYGVGSKDCDDRIGPNNICRFVDHKHGVDGEFDGDYTNPFSGVNAPSAASSCCDACLGEGYWALGGEVAADECCGDDSNEYPLYRVMRMSSALIEDTEVPSDDACCNDENDCVNNDACYSPDTTPSVDVDSDGDTDYCTSTGVWKDCNTDAQCGSDLLFGEYEICEKPFCVVNCLEEPCLAGEETCYDEVEEETLYCVNTNDVVSQSSFVENPAGSNDNERYCREGQYYDPDFGCAWKVGADICYNSLDSDPTACGTLNLASMIDCGYPVEYYCDAGSGKDEKITIIDSDNRPNEKINNGPSMESNFILEQNCIDTDNGDDPKNWGCTYVMDVETSNDGEHLQGYIACDQVKEADLASSIPGSKLIEHYCSGGQIVAKAYSCSIQAEDTETPHCWETPNSYSSAEPILEPTPD